MISGQATRLNVLLESAAREGFDLVVIDTGPAADAAARRSAEFADLVLIPCRPSAFDLKAIRTTLDLVSDAHPRICGFERRADPQPIRGRGTGSSGGLGAKVAPVVICQRAAYGHSIIAGQTAQEFEPEGKAAEEIDALWQWARGELQIPPKQTQNAA